MTELFQTNARKLFAFISIIFIAALAFSMPAKSDPYTYTWKELAPGVWSGVRDYSQRIPVVGNITFVIGDEGVIVFDAGPAPVIAERLLIKISEVTDKPITHLILSHQHGDHHLGTFKLLEKYPDAQLISSAFTRKVLLSKNLKDYLIESRKDGEFWLEYTQAQLEKGTTSSGAPLSEKGIARYQEYAQFHEMLDADFRQNQITLPNVTYDKKLVIFSGSREIHILHLGMANTEGDSIMWLPNEKIVVTGDAVVWPTPYAFNTDPKKWAATLRAINDLDYDILVPGHGEIQWNMDYVNLMIWSLDSVAQQTDEQLAKGLTKEETGEALDFTEIAEKYTGGDAFTTRFYMAWFENPLRYSAPKTALGEPVINWVFEDEDPETE